MPVIDISKVFFKPLPTDVGSSKASFEERFKARVEQERSRRIAAGMDVGEGWASPEWLNQLRNEMLQSEAQTRSDELSDPSSKYYTDYYKKLKGTLSAQSSLNSLLGLNRAMGLSMAGSATIANEQRNALEGRITDYAGQATKDFAASNIGQANSLLGLGLQNTQSMRDYYFQKQQYEDSKKFDWGGLLKTAGQIAGIVLAAPTGGASLAASAALSTLPTARTSFGSNIKAPPGTTQRGGSGGYYNTYDDWYNRTYRGG